MVVPQNVAHILAKEAFNALTKLLYAIHIPLIHLPLDAGTWLKRWNLLIHSEIPGDVGHQILDHRKSLHRKESDGLVERKSIQPCLASEPRPTIHFSRAGAALPGFTIPPHCQIGCLVRLNPVQRVKHHHSRDKRYSIVDGLSTLLVA